MTKTYSISGFGKQAISLSLPPLAEKPFSRSQFLAVALIPNT
ncbi:MAG: hypothetical protein NTV00_06210 [Methylococcales bacterium]|nr:hypothetical protein [Methylococcales bacterium]